MVHHLPHLLLVRIGKLQRVGAIGSHIDSLTTVLKPNSTKAKVDGYELLGVAHMLGH